MSRLFLFLLLMVLGVAIAAFLVSIWNSAYEAGRAAMRPVLQGGKGGLMAPTGIQKIAFVALIVLMLGVTSGWLGGL